MGGADEVVVTPTPVRYSFDRQSDATSADLEDIGPTGLGAVRARIVARKLTNGERWAIFISVLILGFAYGLESMLRVVYQASVTEHPLAFRMTNC